MLKALLPESPPRLKVPMPGLNKSPLSELTVTVLFCTALALPRLIAPPVIVAPPPKVLAAVSSIVPPPAFTSWPLPLIRPE